MRRLIAVTYCIVLGTYLCSIITDAEFFYHLTVGNWIASHGGLPARDLWTAGAGRGPLASSWMFQFYLSLLETTAGFSGVAVLKLILCSSTALTLFFLFRSICGSDFFAAVVTTLVSCGLLERAALGPALAAMPLLIGGLLAVTTDRRLVAFALSAALTNTDANWTIAALVAAMVVVESRAIARVVFAFGAFMSPFLGVHLLYRLTELDRSVLSMHPLMLRVDTFAFAFLAVVWVLTALMIARRTKSPLLKRVLIFAGFVSIAAAKFEAMQPFALILTGIALSLSWIQRDDERPIVVAIYRFAEKLGKLPAPGVIWVLCCLVVVNSLNFYRFPVLTAHFPANEVDYIIGHDLPEPLWHEKEIRPYLIYRFAGTDGSPRRLLSFDARSGVTYDELGAMAALVRRGGAVFKALSADPRFELLSLADPAGGEVEQSRQLPEFWALFSRKIEQKPVL